MTITIRRNSNDRLIELGGGEQPLVVPRCLGGNDVNVDLRLCYNSQGQATVDFTCDFNEPLPIRSGEFDGVISVFCLEHISWRKTKSFLGEVFRIIKAGGRVVIVTANTEAQVQWIKDHPNGWDNNNAFDSFSGVLFGDQNYAGNFHSCYFSPVILTELFQQVGFERILIRPYGARDTDLCVEAIKPEIISGLLSKAIENSITVSDNCCGEIGPMGVVCVLEKGHSGKHKGEKGIL